MHLTNCEIELDGNEKEMNIYVKGDLTFYNTAIKYNNGEQPINIYVEGKAEFNLNQPVADIHVSIYAENKMNFENYNNQFYGTSIISNNVYIYAGVVQKELHDSALDSESISLNELKDLEPNNDSNKDHNNEYSKRNIDFKENGPLHEIKDEDR